MKLFNHEKTAFEEESYIVLLIIVFGCLLIFSSYKAFGLDEKEKIIDDIDKVIEQLDKMMRDNLNGTNPDNKQQQHNFNLEITPMLPKVCGLMQMENGFYIEAQKMWCHTF